MSTLYAFTFDHFINQRSISLSEWGITSRQMWRDMLLYMCWRPS